MTASDWTWGPGGKEGAPVPPFEFVKEDLGGTNPKVKVRDALGRVWRVKFGSEVHSETFSTRLVTAAGYFLYPTYYVSEGVIAGVHDLKRARPFISADGQFRYAAFKFHDEKTLPYADEYNWTWTDNPFLGSHELNGLKILMMLASNWDAKDATDKEGNTSVFLRKADSAYLYSFTDWGATMGKWGSVSTRTKWDCINYARDTKDFVKREKDGVIEWGYSGKHKEDITRGIRVEDVRWLLPYLSPITDEELSAGLAASGATAEEAACFTRAIRERIQVLERVAHTREVSATRP